MLITADLFLILIIVVGVLGKANTVSVAASLLLVMRMLNMQRWFPMIERRSLEFGLLFLMISILTPLASERVSMREIVFNLFTPAGFATIIGGIIATLINAKGLALLQSAPSLLFSVLIGTIAGIILFKGMPVGPLMATAIAAVCLQIVYYFKNF